VYKITSPTNRIYIGSTVCISRRLAQYKNYFTKSQRKLHNSFLKYGYNSHKFEIIWEGPAKERLKHEALLGLKLNCLSEKNLNCKLPKIDEDIYVVSKETRKKMSKWQIGRKMSKEAKLKMSKSKLGKKQSNETKQKISKAFSKPIIQYDLYNNYIKEWKSAAEVQRKIKINSGHIRECCRKERKTAGGFKWSNK